MIAKIATAVDSRLIAANNDFGFRLFAQLVEQDTGKNVFVSPSSIAIALAMTYNGAAGTTQQAMAQTLGLEGLSLQEVNEANAALLAMLQSPDPQVQLAIANSLWAQMGLTFQPNFMQKNKDFYQAEVTNLDFTHPSAPPTINGWVKEKTNGKIKELIKPEDCTANTVLILLNAIYFKGIWTVQFAKAKTKQGIFTLLDGSPKQVPLMSQSGRYRYYEGENFQAVSLPYGKGRISLYIFLPGEATTLQEFQQSLNLLSLPTS
jgi:serpin B